MCRSKRILLLILLFAGVSSAFAQEDDSLEPAIPVENARVGSSKIRRAVKQGKTNRHWQVRPGLAFWQENINLRSGADTAQMQSQSEGLLVDVAYVITPYRSRWRQIYGLEFGNGRVKGKGNTASIPDELRGQTWIIAGASASLMYRSSLYSEFGLIAPFNYRAISWALQSSSTLDPDKDTSFSAGLGLAYLVRFGRRQGVHFAMIRHFGWDATMWAASYQLEFN
jgi:hypothetical protein